MEKRSSERFPVHIDMRYYLWNPLFWKKLYPGIIENISQKGMFISTKTPPFPGDSLLEIFVPFKEEDLYLPAKMSNIVWRKLLPDNSCEGIGIEISNPPREFLEFVESLKS